MSAAKQAFMSTCSQENASAAQAMFAAVPEEMHGRLIDLIHAITLLFANVPILALYQWLAANGKDFLTAVSTWDWQKILLLLDSLMKIINPPPVPVSAR